MHLTADRGSILILILAGQQLMAVLKDKRRNSLLLNEGSTILNQMRNHRAVVL